MYEVLDQLNLNTMFGTAIIGIGILLAIGYLVIGLLHFQHDIASRIQGMTLTSAALLGVSFVSLFIATLAYITTL